MFGSRKAERILAKASRFNRGSSYLIKFQGQNVQQAIWFSQTMLKIIPEFVQIFKKWFDQHQHQTNYFEKEIQGKKQFFEEILHNKKSIMFDKIIGKIYQDSRKYYLLCYQSQSLENSVWAIAKNVLAAKPLKQFNQKFDTMQSPFVDREYITQRLKKEETQNKSNKFYKYQSSQSKQNILSQKVDEFCSRLLEKFNLMTKGSQKSKKQALVQKKKQKREFFQKHKILKSNRSTKVIKNNKIDGLIKESSVSHQQSLSQQDQDIIVNQIRLQNEDFKKIMKKSESFSLNSVKSTSNSDSSAFLPVIKIDPNEYDDDQTVFGSQNEDEIKNMLQDSYFKTNPSIQILQITYECQVVQEGSENKDVHNDTYQIKRETKFANEDNQKSKNEGLSKKKVDLRNDEDLPKLKQNTVKQKSLYRVLYKDNQYQRKCVKQGYFVLNGRIQLDDIQNIVKRREIKKKTSEKITKQFKS